MSCTASSLDALRTLHNLETLHMGVGYRERLEDDSKTIYARDDKLIEARVWALIEADKRGETLPANWLQHLPERAAKIRTERRKALEQKLRVLQVKIRGLQAEAAQIVDALASIDAEEKANKGADD